ncbi:MAG: PIG-L deacetylase family protein [Acidimicrobiales bacterium]
MRGSESGGYVFLSPHPDDIALSLGSICGNAELRARLVTVFSRTDWLGPDEARDEELATKIRQAEDAEFARLFSLEHVDLGFADFPLRTGLPVETCCSSPTDATAAVLTALLQLPWRSGSTMLAPAGTGGHVDHLACHDAAVAFGRRTGMPVLFYSDMPYAIRPGAVVDPARSFVAGDGESWFRAVKCYPSQSRLLRETVHLAGPDGAPVIGAYLSPRP